MSPVSGQNRYRCTRTSGHLESLVEGRIVLHCLQIGGAKSKLFLLGALGIILGIILEVDLGSMHDEVTLFSSASHVAWAESSGGGDAATAVFTKMSWRFNNKPTTASTQIWHELRDTPPIVVCVGWPQSTFQSPFIHYKASLVPQNTN